MRSRLHILFIFVLFFTISGICNNNANLAEIDTLQINNRIPLVRVITVFDTIYNYNFSYEVYDLVTTITIFDLKSNSLIQQIIDTSYSLPMVLFKDINQDNYTDIELSYSDDRSNSTSYFWLYDTSNNKFVYSNNFSGLENYTLNPDSKIISTDSHSFTGNGSFSTLWSDYLINDNDLLLIEKNWAYQDEVIFFTSGKNKLINGVMRTTEQDSIIHLDNYYVFKSYKMFFDSLLISSIYWAYEDKVRLTDSTDYSIYTESEFTGVVLCFKKEVFYYKLDDNGKLITELKVYEVINNKWELVNN